jgi:cysteinyl-tRNA synthetase
MNFTEESLSAAYMNLDRLKKMYRTVRALENGIASGLLDRVTAALDEDMNTSVALAAVLQFSPQHGTLQEFERALWLLGIGANESWLEEPARTVPDGTLEKLRAELSAEISFNAESAEEAIERIISIRAQARAAKDFAASDRLRDALARCGILVKDSKTGATWSVAP